MLARSSFLLLLLLSLSGHAYAQEKQDKTEAATRQYEAAVALQNRGVYAAAAMEWVKFIDTYRTDPRSDQAFHYLGVCYLKAGDLDLARQCFEIVVKFFPKCHLLDATYFNLGVTQYNLGQSGKAEMFDAAAATFQTLIAKYPDDKHAAQALFYRGECLYHRGQKQDAAEMYAQLLAKFPRDKLAVDALYALGVSQQEMGQHAEAEKTYAQFLEKHPQHPLAAEVVMRRATALSELKNYGEAATLYASLPAKWPQSNLVGAANLAGGKCYYLAGDFAQARRLLDTVLAGGGEPAAEAAHWLARSLSQQGKPAEAAALLEEALPKFAESPQLPQLLMDQADALYDIPQRRGESGPLYAALAAKYAHHPVAPQALYMAAFAALGKGDFSTALKHAAAFLAAHPDHPRAADVTSIAAESHLQSGQFAEAGRLFAALLEKYPRRADAESWQLRRGLSLYLQKKYAETIALAQPLLGELRAPDAVAEAHYLLGGSQVELKQPAAAVKSLEASLAAQPKWRQADDVLLLLGRAYSELKDGEKANAALRRLLAEFPQSRLLDRAHYRLGEQAYAGGDFATAAAEYQRVIDNWPQGPLAPHALHGLAWVKLSQNDYPAAETLLSELLDKYPDHKLVPHARYARGMARQQMKRFAPAIDDVEALLAADPTPAERSDARYLLGLCEVGLQKHADAAAVFQTLLADDPQYAGADKVLYELAWALQQQDKEEEAAAAFARLADEHPQSPLAAEAHFRVAESLFKREKFAEALAAYQQVQNPAGKDFEMLALLHAGQAAARLAQWDKGLGLLSRCIEQFPDSPCLSEALCEQGWVKQNLGKLDEAAALYEKVLAKSDGEVAARAQFLIGQIQFQRKDYAAARDSFFKVTYGYSYPKWQAEAAYEAGRCFEALGKRDQAVKQYREVIEKYRQSDKVPAAKQRLEDLQKPNSQ